MLVLGFKVMVQWHTPLQSGDIGDGTTVVTPPTVYQCTLKLGVLNSMSPLTHIPEYMHEHVLAPLFRRVKRTLSSSFSKKKPKSDIYID